MSQSAYLFLGGPLDQQWRHVPRGRTEWKAYEMERQVVIAVENMDGPITSRMVNYYRRTIIGPGWMVAFHVFTTDLMGTIEPGTPMPGGVEGGTPDASSIITRLPLRLHLDKTEWGKSQRGLHDAIKRRGFRP